MIKRPLISDALRIGVVLLAIVLAGCQPRVHLKPTPAAFSTGEHDPFAVNPVLEKTNRVQVLYATNRLPLGLPAARAYTFLPSDILHLGVATLRIGAEDGTWEELYRLSTSADEADRPLIELENLKEVIRLGEDDDHVRLNPEARAAFDRLNALLARSLDKDIMVYVHGANTNVYRATAQAAQYRHFTGRNSVVVAFAWPSTGTVLRYGTDVANARQTVPVFARFIELLARHTSAENINILAYSAGAQVTSPGLALLAEGAGGKAPGAVRKRLRLGEIYFAAPDVDFKAFVEQLPAYLGVVRNVTVSVNLNDRVLAFAQSHHGVSRAGRPDPDELTAEQTQWIIEASGQPHFDVISVEPSDIPQLSRGAHAFWYDNPWVSSDLLIQFLFHARPARRGLEEIRSEKGFVWWTFPTDYEERVIEIVRNLR